MVAVRTRLWALPGAPGRPSGAQRLARALGARSRRARGAAAQAESYNKLIYRNTPVAAGVRLPLLSRGRDGAAARASGERRVGTTRGGQVCDLEEQAGEHSSRRMAEPRRPASRGGLRRRHTPACESAGENWCELFKRESGKLEAPRRGRNGTKLPPWATLAVPGACVNKHRIASAVPHRVV